jgi:polar amino acid transport system substrate-binding protein
MHEGTAAARPAQQTQQIQETVWEVAVDEALAPYSFSCGQQIARGSDIDLLLDAAKLAGIRLKIVPYPWKRVLYLVQNGQVPFALPLFYNEERAGFAHFIAPLHQGVPTLFIRKEKLREYTSLQAMKGKRIGYSRGYALPSEFTEAIQNGVITGDEVNSSKQNMQNLMLQRIDGFIASYTTTQFDLHFTEENGKIVAQPAIVFGGRDAFLVASKAYKADGLEKVMNSLKTALTSLNSGGKAEKYIQPYLDKNAALPCQH